MTAPLPLPLSTIAMRRTLTALFAAVIAAWAVTVPAAAATNNQSGLVNVNVQNLSLALPVSVAVPVSVAADVCGISVAALAQQVASGPYSCPAQSNSTALSTAVADAMTGNGSGNRNNQSGLVNVNLQGIALALPISVAVPVSVAANVCGINAAVLAQQAALGPVSCSATSSSQALSRAIAAAMA